MSEKITRREMVIRALYVAPAILTLTALPAFAKNGSGNHHDHCDNSLVNSLGCPPPGNPPSNDGLGTGLRNRN
jgi:hypothetical protein